MDSKVKKSMKQCIIFPLFCRFPFLEHFNRVTFFQKTYCNAYPERKITYLPPYPFFTVLRNTCTFTNSHNINLMGQNMCYE